MRAARWTFRRYLAGVLTEQLVPGRHYQWKARG